MLKSVQLSLLMGPVLPQPAPRAVLDALVEAEIQLEDYMSSGFQLTFSVDKQSPLQINFLLSGSQSLLFLRVVLAVTVNSVSTVLMDGVVTDNRFSPGDKGSNSTLTLSGKDLTALMDQSDRTGTKFPAGNVRSRVNQMLGRYAAFGVHPNTVDAPQQDASSHHHNIPGQRGTDLQYIRSLAEAVNYVFYIQPGTPGNSSAYWGPRLKEGPIQPTLNADMDAYTNVENIHFSVDQEQNRTPAVFRRSGDDSKSIPLSSVAPLNPKLSQIPPQPANSLGDLIPFRDDLAKLPYPQALMLGLAAAARNTEVVTGQGTLDVTRYGGILNARQLVAVRGCSPPFDGLYYVKSVTHNIRRGEYKQSFTLTRDGLGSTISTVNQ